MTQIIIFSPKQTGEEWGVSEHWNQTFWMLYLVTGIPKLCSWLQTHHGLQQSQIPAAESCSGRLFLMSVIQALWPIWEAPVQPPHVCISELPRALPSVAGLHTVSTDLDLILHRNYSCQEAGVFKRVDNNDTRILMTQDPCACVGRIYCSLSCYPESARLEQKKGPWHLHGMDDSSKGRHM